MRRGVESMIGLLGVLALAGCGTDGARSGAADREEYVTNERGLDRRNLDESVVPCVDFYLYANGGWLARNPIPPERSSWSIGTELQERSFEVLRRLLESAAERSGGARPETPEQKVGDFFAAAMDTVRLAELGHAPLEAELARIDAMTSASDLHELITDFHRRGLRFLFTSGVINDLQDSDVNLLYVTPGGLGLPEKDYYFRDEDADTRTEYQAHMGRMLGLMGVDQGRAEAAAQTVMEMETALAEVSLGAVELRNPGNLYRIVTPPVANGETPNFSWTSYLAGLDIQVDRFSFPNQPFFERVNSMMVDRPIGDWKDYLRWHLINAASPSLSPELERADFEFFSGVLSGTEEMEPRWKRALRRTDQALGEDLGQLYVAEAFPPETKVRADEMIENLRAALKARIEALDWMSDETRSLALAKLATFRAKIGYPDKWRDYAAYDVRGGDFFGNVMRSLEYETKRNFDKLGQPPDPDEWIMSPPTVNAYFNPLMNEIVFPAGIMQPPFFDGQMDDAVNYGAMGAVIGHEMTHGYDDQGSRFDVDGNFADWWSEEDRAEFTRRAQVLIDQYSGYEPIAGLHVNGELTLGENIGDVGGLLVAYDAFKRATAGQPGEDIDGFTADQRFFLSFAQAWRGNQREESVRLQVNTDPHSPRQFRTNGVVPNVPGFATAFSCQPGDSMFRSEEERVKIW